jgi:hypothetical protein
LAVALGLAGCTAPPSAKWQATPAGGTPSPGSSASGLPAAPSPSAVPPATGTGLRGCPNLPADNVWHADVSKLPVSSGSGAYVASIGATGHVKADFGAGLWDGGPIGIPITYTGAWQTRVPVSFDYAGESDPGPYPIPRNALVEGGPNGDGDRHVIVLDPGGCRVYEMYDAHPQGNGGWSASSGAVFDLRANKMRPLKWTSADAAGLSIYAGLVRYDEVAAGHVDHAIRMTVRTSQRLFVWPGSHYASTNTDPGRPPMGLRLRLKANVDVSTFPPQARVVAEALKRYGAIVADNGGDWFLSGTQDDRWNNEQLDALKGLHGGDFEAVDERGLMASPTSYAVKG